MEKYLTTQALLHAHVFKKNNQHRNEPPPSYTSIEDYVLDRGKLFKSTASGLNKEQWNYLNHIAIHTDLEFAQKQCFLTAMLMAITEAEIEDPTLPRLTYCEGFAVSYSGVPVHHAWLTLDGRLVDLTRSLRREAAEEFCKGVAPQQDLKDRVLGTIPKGWEYFGVEFPWEGPLEYWQTHEEIGSLIMDYQFDCPQFSIERLGNAPIPDPDWWEARFAKANIAIDQHFKDKESDK